jgi:hypothetical protein
MKHTLRTELSTAAAAVFHFQLSTLFTQKIMHITQNIEKIKRGLRQAGCVLVLTSTLSACDNMLVEAPKSLAVEVFYNTGEEVETAVNAVYRSLRVSAIPNYVATLECQSDWMYGRGSWTPLSDYQGLNDANITRVAGFWNSFYLAIRDANLVIANAPNGNAITQEEISKYVAEARFLRAYIYFQLVRNWGSIPLRTELNMSEKDLAKSTVEEVYSLIVSDLLNAETNLPDTPKDIGRPSLWAAKSLLADVYLERGNYEQAAARAKQVIDSGKFSLVGVKTVRDLQYNLFGPTILTTPEEIFYLKYSRLEAQGNYILWISNHPSTNLFSFGGAYAVHGDKTNPNFVNWEEGDLRKGLWDNIDFGLGANTLVSSKYVDPEAISQNGAGNDQPIYRYAEVLLLFAEAAARSEAQVSEEALEALNKVRRRAYGFDPETPAEIDYQMMGLTAESFIDLIIKERGYEFLYEGKRWHELKRTGKLGELIAYGKNKSVAEKHLLWPIPVSELNYNNLIDPSADQNPGY